MATLAFVRRISQGYSVVWGEKNRAKVRNFLNAEMAHTYLASLGAHKIDDYGTDDKLAGVYSVPGQHTAEVNE
jgi:hypothetical protein